MFCCRKRHVWKASRGFEVSRGWPAWRKQDIDQNDYESFNAVSPLYNVCYEALWSYAAGIIKDVRTHCYCASLVHTLYMAWHVPRHVFQARALSQNSTKYRADDLCSNLICEYFCWMLGDPHFFFGRSLPFVILSIILKKKKICTWEVSIISHILFK